ncbi:hypothetical protein V6N13_143333 [Hibiscus sabdariffa]
MVDLADSVKILGSGNVVDGLDLSNFLTLQKVGKRVLGPCAEGSSAKVVTDWNGWAKQWNNTLVVNFLGKSPPLPVFQRTADKLWGREGSVEIRFLSPSVYLVNFPSSRVHDWVFESGPWHIQQKALILRKWTPGLLPEVLNLKIAPIWIRLWHVPLELYSQQGLSYLASALGKPLYTDKATTLRQHLEFAKICVEVDAKFTLPSSVLVDLGDDNVIDVGVELVWAPPKCSHCSIFGHLEEKCARSVVVDDSAQLNASNGIAKLEIVVSTNLVDFVEVCAQPVERVLDEVSIGVVGNCENVVDDVIAGVVGNCVNVVDDVIVGNLVSSTGVAIFEIVTSFADVVPAQVDDNLLVGDGSGSCSGKDIVVSMGDAVLSPNKFDALATAAVE